MNTCEHFEIGTFLFPLVPLRAVRDAAGDEGGVGRAHVEAHQGRQVHHRGRRQQGQRQGQGQCQGQDAAQPRLLLVVIVEGDPTEFYAGN